MCANVSRRARRIERKNTGVELFQAWTRIERGLDVKGLLRGEDHAVQVLVAERDRGVRSEITRALSIADRWERRSALRGLAARIARNTVSVSEKVLGGLRVRPIDRSGGWNEVLPGQYDAVCGIDSRTTP